MIEVQNFTVTTHYKCIQYWRPSTYTSNNYVNHFSMNPFTFNLLNPSINNSTNQLIWLAQYKIFYPSVVMVFYYRVHIQHIYISQYIIIRTALLEIHIPNVVSKLWLPLIIVAFYGDNIGQKILWFYSVIISCILLCS